LSKTPGLAKSENKFAPTFDMHPLVNHPLFNANGVWSQGLQEISKNVMVYGFVTPTRLMRERRCNINKINVIRKIMATLFTLVFVHAMQVIVFAADALGGIEDTQKFFKNVGIWFMLILIAYLCAFIRKFEWGVYLAVILSAATACVTYIAIQQFVLGASMQEVVSQDMLIGGAVCAITLVIAIGVFLGTIKTWQYLIAGVLFAPCFVILELIFFTWIPLMTGGGEVTDPGGGILVHFFAPYWGLGVALALREKRAFAESMKVGKHNAGFMWMAAFLLFVLWPTFVTALLPPEEGTAVAMNCYFSGFGSIITAYITCLVVSKKVDPLVYVFSLLAGQVASSSTLQLAGPWDSFAIGAVAGVIVALSFIYLHPWLCKKLGVLDVMGAHNLHCVGGLISMITGAIYAGSAVNFLAGLFTFLLGIASGALVGLIIKATRGEMTDDMLFNDKIEFVVPEEDSLELEVAMQK
jgi:ammonium transporter Rh